MENFDQYAIKGNLFLKEIAQELGNPQDKARAGRILRAVLHALRNTIPLEESFQLLAQLPIAIKGLYVEGWTLKKLNQRVRHIDEFAQEVYREGGAAAPSDFPDLEETKRGIMAVIRVLRKHITPGEIEDIRSTMTKGLKVLWDEPIWTF